MIQVYLSEWPVERASESERKQKGEGKTVMRRLEKRNGVWSEDQKKFFRYARGENKAGKLGKNSSGDRRACNGAGIKKEIISAGRRPSHPPYAGQGGGKPIHGRRVSEGTQKGATT